MMARQDTRNLFFAQLGNLRITLTAAYSNWLFGVVIEGEEEPVTAVVLAHSFDYWKLRYHMAKHKPSLIIAYQHDTVLPVRVLSLSENTLYGACRFPAWFNSYDDRASKRGAQCLLGALLSGMADAYAELAHLPRTTRYRYLRELKAMNRRRRGRPVEGRKIAS